MASFRDVDPTQLIMAVSKELEKDEKIVAPDWAPFVRTGISKQRNPVQQDWWFTRAASILRAVALLGPVGTNKLRVKYGSKKDRGHKKSVFRPGSGNIIRKALQQLEAGEYIKPGEIAGRKGRIIAPKGQKLLNAVAQSIGGQDGKKQASE